MCVTEPDPGSRCPPSGPLTFGIRFPSSGRLGPGRPVAMAAGGSSGGPGGSRRGPEARPHEDPLVVMEISRGAGVWVRGRCCGEPARVQGGGSDGDQGIAGSLR